MTFTFKFYMRDGTILFATGCSYQEAFEKYMPFKDEYTSQVDHWEVEES